MDIPIIMEDESFLVIDKPAGITVNRSDTTKDELTVQDFAETKIRSTKFEIRNKSEIQNTNDLNSFEFRDSDLEFSSRRGIVHRLDKETSGLLIIAKTPSTFENLQQQFKNRTIKKTYIALTHGEIQPQSGEISVPLGRLPWNRKRFGVVAGGRDSVTKYKVLGYYLSDISQRGEILSLVELYPETGRTHQIRVHLKHMNRPIFADFLYAGRKTSRDDRKFLNRVFLHAHKITFRHPVSNEALSFESTLAPELTHFLKSLKIREENP